MSAFSSKSKKSEKSGMLLAVKIQIYITTLSAILIAGGRSVCVSVKGERRVMGRRRSGAVIFEAVSLVVVPAVSCLAAEVHSPLLQTL